MDTSRNSGMLNVSARRVKLMLSGIFVLLLCSGFKTAGEQYRYDYINKYKDLAIEYMKSHKVPASITLAQAILESDCGRSALAKVSNNHFGIMDKPEWKGRTVEHPERPGEYYRAYDSVEDSYYDHAEFLAKRERYKPLFELEITDYTGWAHGLLKCGYATDPKYPDKLIRIIEKYRLNLYDKEL